jgi:transcriptional regulator with XRE-family HTH domain
MNITLKNKIFESGKHQYSIAKMAKMSETKLSRIVQGRFQPTEQEQQQIAQALDTTVQELFTTVSEEDWQKEKVQLVEQAELAKRDAKRLIEALELALYYPDQRDR